MSQANARGQGHGVARPRLLLLPGYSELEWVIRPQLEEWAEVAVFDAPGVGDESPPGAYDSAALAERAAAEVDRLGWQSCVLAADEFAIAAALKFAAQQPDAVQGLALGHACLSFSPDADPPRSTLRLARRLPRWPSLMTARSCAT